MGDLVVYRGGGLAWLHGHSLYTVVSGRDHLHFTYPPFAAVVLSPLGAMPLAAAKLVLSLLTLGCLAGCLWLVLKRLAAEASPYGAGWLPLLLAAAIWLEPVRATFDFGQINAILMALVVVDVLHFGSRRYGGVPIGIAAAIKLTPLAFVPFLFVIGRRRAALTAVGTFVGCALLGVALAPGASRSYWGHHRFLQAHRIGRAENASNQSVRGILARALRTGAVPGWWVALAAVLLLGGLLAAMLLHRRGLPVWALATMAVTTLIASPVSWSHHWVWCAVLGIVAIDVVRRNPTWERVVAAAGVIAPFAAGAVFLPDTRGRELLDSWWEQLLSASYVIAGLLLVAVLMLVSTAAQVSSGGREQLVGEVPEPVG
jgi:alpha-1,2-mannosyltransferase